MQDIHPQLERCAKAPGVPELIRWNAPLRVWRYTRWHSSSWTVFYDKRPVSGERALVRKVTLERRRTNDVIQEKIEAKDFPIDSAKARAFKRKLKVISIAPFVGNRVMYLDSPAFGVESVADRVFFEWQDDGPNEWSSLTSVVRGLIAEFEKLEEEPNQSLQPTGLLARG